jgi:membrane protease YdiL (CAAX protease family)
MFLGIIFSISGQEEYQFRKLEDMKPITDQEREKSEFGKDRDPSPRLAAFLGIIPGLGQAYIGDHLSFGVQAGTFLGISSLRRQFLNRPDYIPYDEREVKFDIVDASLGAFAQRNGLVYTDLPIWSETKFDRNLRLYKEGQLAELNTFIKYGNYSRESRSTIYADSLSNPMLSSIFYSIYSSYRDAGGLGEYKKLETFADLAYAPFNYQVLKKPLVFVPILGIAFLSAVASYGATGEPTLVPKSVKQDGSLYYASFMTGISPAIGEEAYFRGVLNYNLSMRFGPHIGVGTSGIIFMLAHEGNSDARQGRPIRLLAGLYLGFLHVASGYDIRPSVAVHFWFNFLVSLGQIASYKPDPNYNKSQREVFFMPIEYTFRF